MKAIADRAEVSVDFPEKTYIGAFGRESSFDVKIGPEEVLLRIVRAGTERRQIGFHLHYFLLADILTELGRGLEEQEPLDGPHLEALRQATKSLAASLKARPQTKSK